MRSIGIAEAISPRAVLKNKRSMCCHAEVAPQHSHKNWMLYKLVCKKCLEFCDYLEAMDLSDCCNASIKTLSHDLENQHTCLYCNKNCKPVPSLVSRGDA